MSPPRRLIVVASPHRGNTRRVAEVMADVLGAEVVVPDDVAAETLRGCELVGFGSGVYYGRMHESLFALVRRFSAARGADAAAAPRAFVFSTSGLPFLAKAWHAPLVRLLADKGFDVAGAFACRGFDTWGPLWLVGGLNRTHPDARDLARAREFAARVR
jgi:flavodoxin